MLTLNEARTMLADLGFWFLKEPPTTGTAFWVGLACREFQRYARMSKAAKDSNPGGSDPYPKRLVQVDNASPLPANIVIDGEYNEPETESRIKSWHAAKWRIPLVISAWDTKANGDPISIRKGCENIWLRDEVALSRRVRMFATDLSDLYEPWDSSSVYRPIAQYTPFDIHGVPWGGPWARAGQHTWAEIDYISLTGDTAGPPTKQEEIRRQQTFRVIVGVANAEAELFFDAVNAYDDSIISVGFYQWTFGLAAGATIKSGELGGFMALLKYRKAHNSDPAFDLLMGRWDLDVKYGWDTIEEKIGLFNFTDKKYTTHFTEKRKTGSGHTDITITEKRRAQFFQSWHWFYRFQAACRFSPYFQRSMWHMARVRLRDILKIPWPEKSGADFIPKITVEGVTRPATIGEVYRSELATAIILRWHVWAPGEVTYKTGPGRGIRRAFNLACRPKDDKPGINPKKLVNDWPDEWEEALIAGLKDQIPNKVFDEKRERKHLVDSVKRLESVKTELDPPGLQRTRSFKLDDVNLPPAPPLEPIDA